MAKLENWAVRTSKETKQFLIRQIKESDLSAGEFLDQLVAAWLTNKTETTDTSEEILEFKKLISLLSGMFTDVLARKKQETGRMSEELEIKKTLIEKLSSEKEKLITKNKTDIEKLKEKISALDELVIEYKGFEEANRKLEKENIGLNNSLKNAVAECDRLKAQMAGIREGNRMEIEQLKKQTEKDMNLLSEKKDLEAQKEHLKIRLEYESKLEKMNREYKDIIRGFQNL